MAARVDRKAVSLIEDDAEADCVMMIGTEVVIVIETTLSELDGNGVGILDASDIVGIA